MQKARCQYLKNSDRCTKFFHDLIKRNNKRNARIAIDLDDGSCTMDGNIIVNEFVNHYKKLLGARVDREPLNDSWLRDGNMVSMYQTEKLTEPLSVYEIKVALWDIDNEKAPRPDGYEFFFFKKGWNIVGMIHVRRGKSFYLR